MEQLGTIRVLARDTEIFGFAVAEYLPCDSLHTQTTHAALKQTLRRHARKQEVALLSARLPALRTEEIALLCTIGFRVVDYALEVRQTRLQRVKLPALRSRLRPARRDDAPAIVAVAESSFQYGRYHGDGRFPRHLADRRYGVWARNAIDEISETNLMFALDAGGRVAGFFDVKLVDPVAELKLGAVDTTREHGLLGFHLYAGVLDHLQSIGVDEVSAHVSAANTAVLNLYTAFGFQLRKPEVVMHWHIDCARIGSLLP
jgi:ribosomal protein S18 acetylase RimI-like enzyme